MATVLDQYDFSEIEPALLKYAEYISSRISSFANPEVGYELLFDYVTLTPNLPPGTFKNTPSTTPDSSNSGGEHGEHGGF